MGKYLDLIKDEIRLLLRNKKTLINILILGVLILGLFLGVDLARKEQIFRSRASNPPISFTGDNVQQKAGGWVLLDSSKSATLVLTAPEYRGGGTTGGGSPAPSSASNLCKDEVVAAALKQYPDLKQTVITDFANLGISSGSTDLQIVNKWIETSLPSGKVKLGDYGWYCYDNKKLADVQKDGTTVGTVDPDNGKTIGVWCNCGGPNTVDTIPNIDAAGAAFRAVECAPPICRNVAPDSAHNVGAECFNSAHPELYDPAKAAPVKAQLNSASACQSVDSGNSISKFLSQGLVSTVYAAGEYPCLAPDQVQYGEARGSCQQNGKTCTAYPEYAYTDENGQVWCNDNACGEPCSGCNTVNDCGNNDEPCKLRTCVNKACGLVNASQGSACGTGKTCDGNGACVANSGIASEADGQGGCCDQNAAVNTAKGCRKVAGGYNEVCTIQNGGCASGFSCQSLSGCAYDTDCGLPNNHCAGGQCVVGPPTGACQSASSYEVRFRLPGGDWASSLNNVSTGTQVTIGVFRNGTGAFAGAPINGFAVKDNISGSISGPGGFNQSLNLGGTNTVTPLLAGSYKVTASCPNNVTGTGTMVVTGANVSPSPSASGTSNCLADSSLSISPTTVKVGDTITFSYPAGKDINLDDTWSAGGIGDPTCTWSGSGRKYTCTATSAGTGTWNHYWNSRANCGSATYVITAGSGTVIPATHFRIAEKSTDIDAASWSDYTGDGMTTDFTFTNKTPGLREIWVQFKYGEHIGTPQKVQIRILGAAPAVTGCYLSFESSGNTTILNLTGTNFGSAKGVVKSGDKTLETKQWNNTSIKAVYPGAPEGEKLPVALTNADGQASPDGQFCSATVQLSLGAKVFCRTASAQDTPNVDLTLSGDFPGGKKVKQKVTVDKEGNVAGLSQKLEDGKNYKLSLKAPKSVRKTASFTAGSGTINIPNFILPVGDIFPLPGGDGAINALDKSELNRQWIVAGSGTGRTGDFNGDGRVNSIDWACMRYDFGSSDDAEPVAP